MKNLESLIYDPIWGSIVAQSFRQIDADSDKVVVRRVIRRVDGGHNTSTYEELRRRA